MGWKNWPYWTKGGIIGLIISIFIGVISIVVGWVGFDLAALGLISPFVYPIFIIISPFYGFFENYLFRCAGEGCWGYYIYMGVILFIFEFFIIGAICVIP